MLAFCCKCGQSEEAEASVELFFDELKIEKLGGPAPGEADCSTDPGTARKTSSDLTSQSATLDSSSQPVTGVTEQVSWQPPSEHRVVFEADLLRREKATKLLGTLHQRVDSEIFSTELKPVLAGRLDARHFCSDDTLIRHSMLCEGNLRKTLASLKATVQWRAEFFNSKGIVNIADGGVASTKSCQCCMKDPRAHCFLHVGKDAAGHHVVYSCSGAAMNKSPLDGCKHMALQLERLFNGNSEPGRVVWIVNMSGTGIADCNPRTPMMALPMFFNHYPERFAQIILWGMPKIFYGMWQTVMSLVDPITKSRIIIQRNDAERLRYADAYWSNNAEMAAWLKASAKVSGAPGDFPNISLSRQLLDAETRSILERCEALRSK